MNAPASSVTVITYPRPRPEARALDSHRCLVAASIRVAVWSTMSSTVASSVGVLSAPGTCVVTSL
jgi:hypothetical protein